MQPIQKLPLREQVAERLRQAIESGSLKPSSDLQEVAVARDLGVSRTPMREAFVQLEHEGYVVSESGRGFRVAPISMEDGIQIERLVAALERLALETSAAASASDLLSLRRLQTSFRDATSASQQQALDDRLHALLTSRSENRWVLRSLVPLKGHIRRYSRIYLGALGSHDRSVTEHEEILDKLDAGDQKAAGRLIEKHWVGGIARVTSGP